MDPALLQRHWPVLDAKLRQRFPLLGSEPIAWKDGEEDELIHGIAKRAGRPRTFIDGFLESAVAGILRGGNVPATTVKTDEELAKPSGFPDGQRRHGT